MTDGYDGEDTVADIQLVDLNGPHPSGDTKPCEGCPGVVIRLRREGPKRWGKRRFCDGGCAANDRRAPDAAAPGIPVSAGPSKPWPPRGAPGWPATPGGRPTPTPEATDA